MQVFIVVIFSLIKHLILVYNNEKGGFVAKFIENIREQPAYTIREASRYLRIPYSTLKDWVKGFPRSGQEPIIFPADESKCYLSFINLIEIYVLSAIRRCHNISFPKVRKALTFLKRNFPSKHPLADQLFSTDGLHLFIKRYGNLINISREGQMEMENILKAYLVRIERDNNDVPIKLYPLIRKSTLKGTNTIEDEPKGICIDSDISFGRPVLAGTGIPTAVIYERFMAGDTIADLVSDYQVSQESVEDAIRCEQEVKAA
jgi:uncharacterized protein (DUF433 family)